MAVVCELRLTDDVHRPTFGLWPQLRICGGEGNSARLPPSLRAALMAGTVHMRAQAAQN